MEELVTTQGQPTSLISEFSHRFKKIIITINSKFPFILVFVFLNQAQVLIEMFGLSSSPSSYFLCTYSNTISQFLYSVFCFFFGLFKGGFKLHCSVWKTDWFSLLARITLKWDIFYLFLLFYFVMFGFPLNYHLIFIFMSGHIKSSWCFQNYSDPDKSSWLRHYYRVPVAEW